MKHLYKIILLLTPLLLSSCGNNTNSSSTTSSEDSSSSISSEASSKDTSSSSTSSSEEHILSSKNPMAEPYIHNQFYLNHIGDIYNTWKSYQGSGQTIAVIDVGFEANHPDFTYEDGTSKVSDKSAYFYSSGSTTDKIDGKSKLSNDISAHGYNNSHGTFCAGVAAAGLNGKGVVGIAPMAELLLLRTDGQVPSINAAFNYAVECGARVVTISIGSYSNYNTGDLNHDSTSKVDLTTAFDTAISDARKAGTVVISAAGNGGASEANRPTEYTYPGATTGVIGVGGLAANKSDNIWSGSSYNSSSSYQFCDVFAPAEYMFNCCDYDSYYDGASGNWKGTSFASPIVAGLAALYFEKYPEATVSEFEQALYNSSHKFSDSTVKESQVGYGRVDVGALLDTNITGTVTAKVKNSGNLYAYCWNSLTGNKNASWPGVKVGSGEGVTLSYDIDASKYDSVIFNDGASSNTAQSVDLLVSSFNYDKTYNLDDNYTIGNNVYVGKYI